MASLYILFNHSLPVSLVRGYPYGCPVWEGAGGSEMAAVLNNQALFLPRCEQEDRVRRGDDLRLQMALEESKKGGPGSGKLAKKKREVTRSC